MKSIKKQWDKLFSSGFYYRRKFQFKPNVSGFILDLGSGQGNSDLKKYGKVIYSDISDELSMGVQCDAVNLPFKDKSFDYVTSFAMIHHIPKYKLKKLYSEIKRVSRKGWYLTYAELSSEKEKKYSILGNISNRTYYNHSDKEMLSIFKNSKINKGHKSKNKIKYKVKNKVKENYIINKIIVND